MTKERVSGRRKRTPRGVKLNVHNNRDRDDADKALERQQREERRRQALDEVRREEERLLRRIEREKEAPALGATPGALYVAERAQETVLHPDPTPGWEIPTRVDTPPLALLFPDLPWEGDGESLAIGQARALLRQGYNIRRVVRQSGVGLKWLDDIPIDEAGFGVSSQ